MNILQKFARRESQTHQCTILRGDESMSFLPRLKKRATNLQIFRRALKKSTLISEFHPLSIEYFRSRAAILSIKREQVEAGSFIIHPFSVFRAYYEMWMSLIWLLIVFYMPLNAGFTMFKAQIWRNAQDFRILYMDRDFISFILKIFGMIDIIITFFTGYPIRKRRKVVMNFWKIAKEYISSIFFITDLITSVPTQFFWQTRTSYFVMTCVGFLRILRLPTLSSFTSRTLQIFGIRSNVVWIMHNFLIHYLVFHWFACFHYMVPYLRKFSNGEILPESWIERTDLPELDLSSKYIMCIYRAVGSLLCVNFEKTGIEVWEEKIVYIITFIFGKVYIFYLSVLILNFLLRQRSLEIKYFETISQVQAYMSQKQLPLLMQQKLLHFYEYKYNKKFFKERDITSLLSEKLKGEINLNVCSKLVQNVTLLAHLPQQHLEQVVINLKPEIYLANDIIIKAGSVADCMYFLASGTVGVWTPSGKEVCHLQDGTYFGEISLVFRDKRRTANVVAIEICEVYKLDRKTFRNCFKTNAQLYSMLEKIATERMEITQTFEDVHAKTFLELTI